MDSPLASRESFDDEGQRLKACEENLRRYHQLALAGRLVGATMHEVNNRLAALTNLIFLAKSSGDAGAVYLDEADDQLRSLGEITSRNLSFVRLDTEFRQIDLVDLAASALHLHEQQIAKKRIQVHSRTAESALAYVKRGEIFQVLTNLILNAIEALPHSGNLHVRVVLRGSNAVVTVADDGIGIPERMQSTLFDSFKSHKDNGTGLGLWIVREIIRGHRGTIQYRTRRDPEKSGTVFRVLLPVRAV